MAQLCGSWAKTRKRLCQRHVRAGQSPCYQHRDGSWALVTAAGVSIAVGSVRPAVVQQHAVTAYVDRVLPDDDWTATACDKLSSLVGARLIADLVDKPEISGCRPLADMADVFLNFDARVHGLAADAINQLMFGGRKTTYKKLVEKLVDRIPVPTPANFKSIGRALQATGICACFTNGRNLRTQCACWQQVVQEVGTAAATTAIDVDLDRLLT